MWGGGSGGVGRNVSPGKGSTLDKNKGEMFHLHLVTYCNVSFWYYMHLLVDPVCHAAS